MEELKARKKALLEVIANKTKLLEGLNPRVAAISKAAETLSKTISFRISDELKMNTNSSFLPTPLYILFYQLSIYRETFGTLLHLTHPLDASIQVSIVGNVDEAQQSLIGRAFVPSASKRLKTAEENDKKVKRCSTA